MKRIIAYFLLIIGSLMVLPACTLLSGYPRHYSAEAIEAKVIDAQTKQPLEGVIVVANWELEESSYGGNVPVGQLTVMEAVTDRHGRFVFPAWGPTRPRAGGLREKDPQLLLFKPGYEYQRLLNTFRPGMYAEPVRRSEWQGKTVELKSFKGTTEQYARHLAGDYRSALRFLLESDEWQKTPCLLTVLDAEVKRLGYRSFLALFTVPNLEREKRVNEFLQRENTCERR